jgi:uncharacterized lipoprotein YajG
MKISYLLMAVAGSLVLAGCQRAENSSATQTEQTGTTQSLGSAINETVQKTKDLAAEKRDEFVQSADKRLQDLNAKIEELDKKAASYQGDAKVQADKALAKLRAERDVVQKKFNDLKNSTQEAWEQTKTAFNAAWNEVEKGYDTVKSKFD